MMKITPKTYEFVVWIEDTDGSERKGGTFFAQSAAHARKMFKSYHPKIKILSVELK